MKKKHSILEKLRKGSIIPLSLITLTGTFAFVSFSVDVGLISLTRARMQNAVDAAALAGAQEISLTIREIGDGYEGEGEIDPIEVSEERAREKAIEVAALNGVYVSDEDVEFGRRAQNEFGDYVIAWGAKPYNVVRVQARMDNDDLSAQDAKLPLTFSKVFGEESKSITTHAAAFVESRDLGLVLDFSASMNDDSEVRAYSRLGEADVKANQEEIYDALAINDADLTFEPQFYREEGKDPYYSSQAKIHVTFKGRNVYVESTKNIEKIRLKFDNGNTQTFNTSGYTKEISGSGSYWDNDIWEVDVKSGNTKSGDSSTYGENFEITRNEVKSYFGLNSVSWPFDGGSWNEYLDYTMMEYTPYGGEIDNVGLSFHFGGQTLVNYLIRTRPEFFNTNKHWKAPAQPVNALKNGVKLFVEYLEALNLSDHVGVVTYCDDSYLETVLNDPSFDVSVDISDQPITDRYDDVYQIVKHKQAGHYSRNTGMGYGLNKSINLIEQHSRVGTKPTILLMTDGLANRSPGGFSLPNDWDWSKLTDYDRDGTADYTTSDKNKQYAFYELKRAIDRGYTVHTMTLGDNADNSLMKALAHAGGGILVEVPGGSSIADMQSQLLKAFAKIASRVPPPKLIDDLR